MNIIIYLFLGSLAFGGDLQGQGNIHQLIPAPQLIPPHTVECLKLLNSVSRSTRAASSPVGQAAQMEPKQILEFINYLSEKRFLVNHLSLKFESPTVKALIYEKFGVIMPGYTLAKLAVKFFPSVEAAVSKTLEGFKLLAYSEGREGPKWNLESLIEIAKTCEDFQIPFDEANLEQNSSLIGMKLSEKYGYPITGRMILKRLRQLGTTTRRTGDLAKIKLRPEARRQWKTGEFQWNAPAIVEILKFIKSQGYEVTERFLRSGTQFGILNEKLRTEFGIIFSGTTLYNKTRAYFGSFENAVNAAGLKYVDKRKISILEAQSALTPGIALEALSLALARYPKLTSKMLSVEKSTALGQLFKRELGLEFAGATLYRYLKKEYGGFPAALEKINYITPWMNALHRNTPLTRDKVVATLNGLIARGYIPRASFFTDYSEVVGRILYKEFGVRMSGARFLFQVRELLGAPAMTQLLREKGLLNNRRLLAQRLIQWGDREKVPEYLQFLDRFGIPLTEESLVEHSNMISWILLYEYGVICNGSDLWMATKAQFDTIPAALRSIGVGRRHSSTRDEPQLLPVNAYSGPVIFQLLSDADLAWWDYSAFFKQRIQFKNVLAHYFDWPLPMERLGAAIPLFLDGRLERPTIESQRPGGPGDPSKPLPIYGNMYLQREFKTGDSGEFVFTNSRGESSSVSRYVTLTKPSSNPEEIIISDDLVQKVSDQINQLATEDKDLTDGILAYLDTEGSIDNLDNLVKFLNARSGNKSVRVSQIRKLLDTLAGQLQSLAPKRH